VSDALVVFGEATRSTEPDLLRRSLRLNGSDTTRNRLATGLTYTTSGKLSLTGEYQYNGFALDRRGLQDANAAGAFLTYATEAFRQQEILSRRAYLLYAVQKNAGLVNLDVTALVQFNPLDSSRLAWLEMRYHWAEFDLAVQLQHENGSAASQYGQSLYRRSLQILATYYFK